MGKNEKLVPWEFLAVPFGVRNNMMKSVRRLRSDSANTKMFKINFQTEHVCLNTNEEITHV